MEETASLNTREDGGEADEDDVEEHDTEEELLMLLPCLS